MITLTYTSETYRIIKLIALPVFLIASLVSYIFYLEDRGNPSVGYIPENSQYVFHRVTNEETIVIWITTEKGDRLYVIPYSRESAKELEGAREKSEEGELQRVENKGDNSQVKTDDWEPPDQSGPPNKG
jgi:hypothetical protein